LFEIAQTCSRFAYRRFFSNPLNIILVEIGDGHESKCAMFFIHHSYFISFRQSVTFITARTELSGENARNTMQKEKLWSKLFAAVEEESHARVD